MDKIKKLKEERDALIVEMEKALTVLEESKLPEDKEAFEKLEEQVNELDTQIASLEMELVENQPTEKLEDVIKENEEMKTANEILKEAIYGTDGDNTANFKILLPITVEDTIVQKRQEASVMRQHGTVMSATGNATLPVEKGLATAAFTSEIGAITENTPTFDAVDFRAVRCGSLVKVSEVALKDAAFDLEKELVSQISRAYATVENQKFVNGTGVNEPEGFLNVAKVHDTVETLVWGDIEGLYYGLKAPYRMNAVWMMNSKTVKIVKALLKDEAAQNLPLTEILGRPVVINEAMPDADDGKAIAFGDFAYYKIMDRQGIELKQLDELYAVNGIVGFLANARLDAHLTLSEAVKVIAFAKDVADGGGEATDGGVEPETDGGGEPEA